MMESFEFPVREFVNVRFAPQEAPEGEHAYLRMIFQNGAGLIVTDWNEQEYRGLLDALVSAGRQHFDIDVKVSVPAVPVPSDTRRGYL